MQIAIFIKDGLEQIILTPDTETEKHLLGKMHDGNQQISVHKGSFYECRGGYVRQSTDDNSTIICLRTSKGPTE